MTTSYMPMPNLVGDEEDTLAAVARRPERSTGALGGASLMQEMSVVTKTTSHTHYINWAIDSRSLRIARLAGKGEKRGVIEANVERNGHHFKLELCASGWRNSQDGYSAFYLTVQDDGETFVARYRVQVGEITRISSIRHDFHLGVGFPNFCEQTALEAIISNDNLNFVVTVEVFNCQSQVVPSLRADIAHPERLQVLSKMLESIYKQGLHTDVTLVCNQRRIPAHKAILAAASPVFRAMFNHNCVERSSSEVTLNEFDSRTVESMVRFLYTAHLDGVQIPRLNDEKMGDLCDDLDDEEENQPGLINGVLVATEQVRSPMQMSPPSSSVGAAAVRLSGLEMDVDGKNDDSLGDSKDANKSCASPNCADLKLKCDVDVDVDVLMDPKAMENQHIFNLFRFAEMYKITSLVICCCQKMHSKLDVDSTCDLLIKLDRYAHVSEINKIQESIWEYVKNNYHEIKETPGFQTLLRDYPNVVRQLMDKLL